MSVFFSCHVFCFTLNILLLNDKNNVLLQHFTSQFNTYCMILLMCIDMLLMVVLSVLSRANMLSYE